MSGVPIGAVITYEWIADNRYKNIAYEGYVSLGQYDENKGTDNHGVDDDTIFYYSTQDELIGLLTDPKPVGRGDWRLVSIDEWVFRSDND